MRIALLIVALVVAAPARAQSVNDHFDRISGERTITYTVDGSTDATRPVVTFQTAFDGVVPASMVSLAFVSSNEGTTAPASRFAGCHRIEWWADGQPLSAAPASHRGRVVDGEMVEVIDQDVETSWVLAVAAAQSVRYRVCRNEYALTQGDLFAFGMIAAKLKGATYSRSTDRVATPSATPQPAVEYQGMNWRPRNPDTMFPKRR